MSTDARTPRQKKLSRLSALRNERATWIPRWRDLSSYILPSHGRFLITDVNRGERKDQNIINNTAGKASRTLAAGMMAGITSPARAWFRLTTPDPDLAEHGPVKAWTHVVEDRIRQAFAKSNIYNALHEGYVSLATFGNTAIHIDDDPVSVLRAYVLPIGQYCLANSSRLAVDTVYREYSMTVAQLVEEFKLENCSSRVQDAYENGRLDQWHGVVLAIEPNQDFKKGMAGPRGFKWSSCWFEAGAADEKHGYLREGGYHEFPVLCPRWSVSGEDVYGSGPGIDVLGDVKALQKLEQRKLQVFDTIADPPMVGQGVDANAKTSLLPGDWVFSTSPNPKPIYPAIQVDPRAMTEARQAIQEHAQRINSGYFADLWLMMAQGENNPDMTAREVSERHEEKMLQLGPVMERLQPELLEPLIERAFSILLRNGDIPEPPPELAGRELRIEYLSIMAQAQKMIGIGGVERLASFVGSLAAAFPNVLDKLDTDQTVDEYADMLGVPPQLVRTDEAVAAIRAQRQQQQQQAARAAQAQSMVESAKTLSDTNTESKNGLTDLLGTLGGPASVAPGGAGLN